LVTMPWLILLVFPRTRPRLHWPVWLTVAVCALPGFFYQNTGYAQFGFRFSLDYTPYLVLLLGLSGWSFRAAGVRVLLAASVLVNTWGALAFPGFTELVRRTCPPAGPGLTSFSRAAIERAWRRSASPGAGTPARTAGWSSTRTWPGTTMGSASPIRASWKRSTPAWSPPTTGASSCTSGTTGPTSRWRGRPTR